jgi:ribonucleoside-diphosphate reductase alpha chain
MASQELRTASGRTTRKKGKVSRRGVRIERRFTEPGVHPFDTVEWDLRTATITDDKGEVLFEQREVEVPRSWSQLATNVVVSKYFRGAVGQPGRESSVRQIIGRVVDTLVRWGSEGGYFASDDDRDAFRDELTHLLLHQKMSFNSPVWFNMGVETRPQCSACFINSVDDSMESIMELAKTEGLLFKWGSGTGTNLSPLRSSREALSTGGIASGPVSFMKGYDAFAGVIKSGGKTRRSAKMVILDVGHPDIVDFINCKVNEERKAWALIDAGYDGSFNGEAYSSVYFQNGNNSVRVTDEFMQAVVEDRAWETRAVVGGEVVETHRARDLMRQIAESAHVCGDPGMQYDTTINEWHTCKATDRIYASNPCSEYMFLNDTACNLASLNLMKFRRPDAEFDVEAFEHGVDVTILAQEIIVDNASYPKPTIGENSHRFRPLGLGYANLGALLMSRGIPYDSEDGRDYAAALTALMCGRAYRQSALVSATLGPFAGYPENRDSMLEVMAKHRDALGRIDHRRVPAEMTTAARAAWDEACALGAEHGYRNSQVTVLAPTGTIAFMMDCDTTGIEPDIALVKYKKLVGGGLLKIVNNTVPAALQRLGYDEPQIEEIVAWIDEHETIEGAPHLRDEHLPVFDCAFKPMSGERFIHHLGHVRMMAAVQPFLSGAISKTVNMPENCTIEEVENAYVEAWRLGLKAIAVYRDGSKRTQPLNTGRSKADGRKAAAEVPARPFRHRLPDERPAITHKFSIGGHEGYITVGLFEDGSPGELFVRMAKEGSVISGLMDSFATAVSIMLQYGVPLKVMVNKFSHSRFEPSGFTNNPDIPHAKSVMDYIFRWLSLKFEGGDAAQPAAQLPGLDRMEEPAVPRAQDASSKMVPLRQEADAPPRGNGNGKSRSQVRDHEKVVFQLQSDAPPCSECGSVMVRNGSCYRCINCGSTSGCS